MGSFFVYNICILLVEGGLFLKETQYQKLTKLVSRPDLMERSVDYLAEHMGKFLKKRDKVMICFPDEPATIGALMKEAVLRCEAVPQFLDEDPRWITLLKTTFVTRSDAIIGPPLTMLGLAKLAKHMGTPLFARNVLICGYPCTYWMVDGIERGLDCRVWGCYDPGLSAVVAGFSCAEERCIHLRSDCYRISVLDDAGREVSGDTVGRIVLTPLCQDDICFDTGDRARLVTSPCACGSAYPRLMDIDTHFGVDPMLSTLSESFHYWGSILDCKLANTGCGLEIELIVFPGEKLPKLPSCAKLVVRAWNPETDVPFPHAYMMKKRIFSQESH